MASENSPKINVLFICLGNICRSPMAHAVFLEHISKLPPDLQSRFGTIDSAGTGAYHTREPPDYRTMATLERHDIDGFEHGARKIQKGDFDKFDYILGMDSMNLSELRRLDGRHGGPDKAKVSLFGKFGGRQTTSWGRNRSKKAGVSGDNSDWDGEEVIDPYYGGDEGFEQVYQQVDRFSQAFLKEVLGEAYESVEKN